MMRDNRLFYFDNFRAIAILLIVWGHCYSGWDKTEYYEKLISNAITGGTALFVFISGFFLHHIFYKRHTGYVEFLIKKIISVGVPYFLLSSLYMILYLNVSGSVPTHFSLQGLPMWEVVMINFATGRTLTAYWYIPFVLLLFALTPFFYAFITTNSKNQAFLTVVLFILSSAVFWRPVADINPFHSILYFTPFYLLGIMFSLNQMKIISVLKNYKLLLWVFWGGCLLAMTYLGQVGNLRKDFSLSFDGLDLMVMQKIALIFLIITVLHEFFNYKIEFLDFVARNSFPVFFIHPWVTSIIGYVFDFKADNFMEVSVVFLVVVSISLAVSVGVKGILKSKSKFLIGA